MATPNGLADIMKPPFVLSWKGEGNPLPLYPIRAASRPLARIVGVDAPPWLDSGPTDQPFDFSGSVGRLCGDIVSRCKELAHVDVSRLLFGVTQARTGGLHGLQARVTPLRFRGGRLLRQRQGIAYQVQRYFVNDCEMLYLVTFCLPRFLNQDFDDKFITLFHELFHISPAFDGDLRRHPGRCSLHTHSKKEFDATMADLARAYLAGGPDPQLHDFLRLNFAQLEMRHSAVVGVRVPRPRLIPLPVSTAL